MNVLVDTSVWALALRRDARARTAEVARLHSACRRRGLQVGTIDVLLAQLCRRYSLTLLTTDKDFTRIAAVESFAVWSA
ncbi:MAG: PIN domain-containing protein [Gemmatimonadaceae bacterium]